MILHFLFRRLNDVLPVQVVASQITTSSSSEKQKQRSRRFFWLTCKWPLSSCTRSYDYPRETLRYLVPWTCTREECHTTIIKLQSFLYRRCSRPQNREITERISSVIQSLSSSKVFSTGGVHTPVQSTRHTATVNKLPYPGTKRTLSIEVRRCKKLAT